MESLPSENLLQYLTSKSTVSTYMVEEENDVPPGYFIKNPTKMMSGRVNNVAIFSKTSIGTLSRNG